MCVCIYIYIYIYIYPFSRCFYPKRLTVHSDYNFFCMCIQFVICVYYIYKLYVYIYSIYIYTVYMMCMYMYSILGRGLYIYIYIYIYIYVYMYLFLFESIDLLFVSVEYIICSLTAAVIGFSCCPVCDFVEVLIGCIISVAERNWRV